MSDKVARGRGPEARQTKKQRLGSWIVDAAGKPYKVTVAPYCACCQGYWLDRQIN